MENACGDRVARGIDDDNPVYGAVLGGKAHHVRDGRTAGGDGAGVHRLVLEDGPLAVDGRRGGAGGDLPDRRAGSGRRRGRFAVAVGEVRDRGGGVFLCVGGDPFEEGVGGGGGERVQWAADVLRKHRFAGGVVADGEPVERHVHVHLGVGATVSRGGGVDFGIGYLLLARAKDKSSFPDDLDLRRADHRARRRGAFPRRKSDAARRDRGTACHRRGAGDQPQDFPNAVQQEKSHFP